MSQWVAASYQLYSPVVLEGINKMFVDLTIVYFK